MKDEYFAEYRWYIKMFSFMKILRSFFSKKTFQNYYRIAQVVTSAGPLTLFQLSGGEVPLESIS